MKQNENNDTGQTSKNSSNEWNKGIRQKLDSKRNFSLLFKAWRILSVFISTLAKGKELMEGKLMGKKRKLESH